LAFWTSKEKHEKIKLLSAISLFFKSFRTYSATSQFEIGFPLFGSSIMQEALYFITIIYKGLKDKISPLSIKTTSQFNNREIAIAKLSFEKQGNSSNILEIEQGPSKRMHTTMFINFEP
jgi:hypothetical protein